MRKNSIIFEVFPIAIFIVGYKAIMAKKIINRIKNMLFKEEAQSNPEDVVIPSLEFDKRGVEIDEELRISVAVLLAHSASADQEIALKEAEIICSLLNRNLGISEEAIPPLVQTAVEIRRERERLNDCFFLLSERYNPPQKLHLLAMVWKVILADERVDKSEEKLIVQVTTKLKMSLADSEKAKSMAEKDEV